MAKVRIYYLDGPIARIIYPDVKYLKTNEDLADALAGWDFPENDWKLRNNQKIDLELDLTVQPPIDKELFVVADKRVPIGVDGQETKIEIRVSKSDPLGDLYRWACRQQVEGQITILVTDQMSVLL